MLTLRSSAFQSGEPIPARYTCDGEDVSPPLSWDDPPAETRAFALVMDDLDTPRDRFTHWLLYDLPGEVRELPENVAKTERPDVGGVQGRNDFGRVGYAGPCPPPGEQHRYRFMLYALDAPVGLPPGAPKEDLYRAMEGHVLDLAQLIGTYQR